MAEYDYFPFFIGAWVVNVKRGITQDRHFDFVEVRAKEFENGEGDSGFTRVRVEYIIEIFVIFLGGDPFAVLSVWSRGVEDAHLYPVEFVDAISWVIGSFSDYFNAVEFDVGHDQAKEDCENGLSQGQVKQIWEEDEEEEGSVGPGPLQGETDDGYQNRDQPEILFVFGFHDDHALEVEEKEQQFFNQEIVFSHHCLLQFNNIQK